MQSTIQFNPAKKKNKKRGRLIIGRATKNLSQVFCPCCCNNQVATSVANLSKTWNPQKKDMNVTKIFWPVYVNQSWNYFTEPSRHLQVTLGKTSLGGGGSGLSQNYHQQWPPGLLFTTKTEHPAQKPLNSKVPCWPPCCYIGNIGNDLTSPPTKGYDWWLNPKHPSTKQRRFAGKTWCCEWKPLSSWLQWLWTSVWMTGVLHNSLKTSTTSGGGQVRLSQREGQKKNTGWFTDCIRWGSAALRSHY